MGISALNWHVGLSASTVTTLPGGWWMGLRGSFHESLKLYTNPYIWVHIFFFESLAFFWFSKKVKNYWPRVKYRVGDEAHPSSRGQWLPYSLTFLTSQYWLSKDGWGWARQGWPEGTRENCNLSLLFLSGWFWNPISNPQVPYHGIHKLSSSDSRGAHLFPSTS